VGRTALDRTLSIALICTHFAALRLLCLAPDWKPVPCYRINIRYKDGGIGW
jgi:hypothetical protein